MISLDDEVWKDDETMIIPKGSKKLTLLVLGAGSVCNY
jgi:hypothetical protein